MHMLDALRATIGTRKLARPAAGLRPGLGYYVQGSYVWLHDPTALAADLRSLLQRRGSRRRASGRSLRDGRVLRSNRRMTCNAPNVANE